MVANQTVKWINVQRSYIPADPNSFPDGLHIVDMREEERFPVTLYDGANFLPTSYGVKSYFGVGTTHPSAQIDERVDEIIIFQNQAMQNFMFALCDSGIWAKYGADDSIWVQCVALPDNRGTLLHYPWTWCILDNELYAYRRNGAHVYRVSSQVAAPGYEVVTLTPTFLNMAAQEGIFRAGNRLGFWDSDDSVAWSSSDNFIDFVPDLVTLAGNSKFNAVVGNITKIASHGDGFIIYATRSIAHIQKADSSLYLWEPERILENTGIAYMSEMVQALPDTTHYAYTSTGIYAITNGAPTITSPDVFDFLKQHEGPKYLKLVEGRYLFFEILDPDFENAFPQSTDADVPPLNFVLTAESMTELFDQARDEDISPSNLLNALAYGVFNAPPQP